MNKEFLKMQKLAGIITEHQISEITVSPFAENTPVFVIISPMDGMIVEYSFDVSPTNQERLKQKYSLGEQNSAWYGVYKLSDLLGNKLKSRYDEVSV